MLDHLENPGAPLLLFASHDGHAAAITRRAAARVGAGSLPVDAAALQTMEDVRAACAGRPVVALVAAVRYGKHLPAADRFLTHYSKLADAPPLALATVNLTARKPNKQTLETNPYLKKLVAKHGLSPSATGIFAGRLDYPSYRWIDRQLIRFIMLLTGGPTASNTVVDYTDWASVDAFADAVAQHASSGRG